MSSHFNSIGDCVTEEECVGCHPELSEDYQARAVEMFGELVEALKQEYQLHAPLSQRGRKLATLLAKAEGGAK